MHDLSHGVIVELRDYSALFGHLPNSECLIDQQVPEGFGSAWSYPKL